MPNNHGILHVVLNIPVGDRRCSLNTNTCKERKISLEPHYKLIDLRCSCSMLLLLLLVRTLSNIVSHLLTCKSFHFAHVFLLPILLLSSILGTLPELLLLLTLCCQCHIILIISVM